MAKGPPVDMDMTIPTWLTVAAWTYVAVSVGCAVLMYRTTAGRAARERTIWVIAALYLGPVALWAHRRRGPAPTRRDASATAKTLTGGAASAVAHVVGVPIVVLLGLEVLGLELWAMILVIATLAMVFIALAELTSSVHTDDGRRGGPGVIAALVTAAVTVLAFDIGMGGWMLFLHFGWIMPPADDITFVFLMQLGLILGTVTALPVAVRMTRRSDPGAPATSG